ncbi:hypothetical protein D3C81_1020030 [compost metagenome]
MRAADGDQPGQTLRVAHGQLLADQRTIGIADEAMQLFDVQCIQQCSDGIGLVSGVDRHIEVAIGADEIETEQTTALRIQRAAEAGQTLGPTLLGKARVGRDMTVCGDTAGHQHHRQAGSANQFIAQAQQTLSCVTHRQPHFHFTAHGGDRALGAVEGSSRKFLGGNCSGETHGGIPIRSSHRASRSPCSPCDARNEPSFRWTRGPRRIWHQTQALARLLVAPASKGLSLCRSRWWRYDASALRRCQSLYSDRAMDRFQTQPNRHNRSPVMSP